MDLKERWKQIVEGIQEIISQIHEQLNEQEWYQETQSKWQDLDPQTRNMARTGVLAGCGLLIGLFVLNIVLGVYAKEDLIVEQQRLARSLNTASQELKQGATGFSLGEDGKDAAVEWASIFRTAASRASMNGGDLVISESKKGKETDETEELLFDVDTKKVSIIQAWQFAWHLERSTQPVKIRHMKVETDGPDGYLNIHYALSAFVLK